MATQIHRSVLFNWVGLAVKIATAMVLLPFIVATMGVESYGEYVFLAAIFGYSGLLEFGLRAAILRYTGNLGARGEFEALNRILGTVFGYYLIAAGVVAVGGLVLYAATPEWILPVGASSSFPVYAGVASVVAATSFFRIGWTSVLRANERYDVLNVVEITGFLLRAGLVVLLLQRGYGVLAVLAGDLLDNLFCAAGCRLAVRRIAPRIGLDFRGLQHEDLREVLGYSGWAFLNSMAFQFRFRGPSIIVGGVLSTGAAGFFGVATRLQSYVFQLGTAMNSPFRARATSLAGASGDDSVRQIMYDGTKYLTFLACTLCGLLYVYAHELLVTWMGTEFHQTAVVLRILLLGLTAEISALMLGGALYATGHLKTLTITNLVEAALMIGCAYGVSRIWGLPGIAWSITGALILNKVIVQPLVLLKILAVPLRAWILRSLWRPAITLAVGIGPVLAMKSIWPPANLFAVLLQLGLGAALYFAIAWVVILGPSERSRVRRAIGLPLREAPR